MARLATHRNLGVCRLERIGRRVIALAHLGRVAVGAHEVPVLRPTRPVQLVGVIQLIGGVLAEPALATLFARPRIPVHRDSLQAPTG